LKKARPSASSRRKGVLRYLREASPLAASFGKLHLWREGRPSLSELVPSASFGKLHLWRGGGFPKEAPEVPEGSNFFLNVLREASPLAASSRRKGVLRLPPEGRASFASFGKLHLWRGGGFPKDANLFLRLPPEGRASFGFLPKEGRPSHPSGSFTSGGVAAFRRKRQRFPKEATFSFGFLREASPLVESGGRTNFRGTVGQFQSKSTNLHRS